MTKLQKDHLMILLESMDSKMQVTLEAVGSLNEKIDGVEARLNARIDVIENTLNTTVEAVASLNTKVDALDKKVDSISSDLSAHRRDTELHSSPRKKALKAA